MLHIYIYIYDISRLRFKLNLDRLVVLEMQGGRAVLCMRSVSVLCERKEQKSLSLLLPILEAK